MNQRRLVRHALLLQMDAFLKTKQREALPKTAALSENGHHPSSDEDGCWRGAAAQRDGEEVRKSCWKYPLFSLSAEKGSSFSLKGLELPLLPS